MEAKIISRPEMTLVGIVGTAPSVNELDIGELWERFIAESRNLPHQIDEEKGYEVHIEEEQSPRMHFCLIGVEVSQVEALPLEFFSKVIPAGQYALFTHSFREGSYGDAFKSAYDWVKASEYKPACAFDIQCYDARFKGADDPDSILEILIPVIRG